MPADATLVRLATEDDADALTAIYLDSARHHVAIDPRWHVVPEPADALARIEAKLADAAAELYVAQVAGAVVGMLELRVMEPPPRGAMVRAFRFYERLGYRPYGLLMRKDVAPEGNNGG